MTSDCFKVSFTRWTWSWYIVDWFASTNVPSSTSTVDQSSSQTLNQENAKNEMLLLYRNNDHCGGRRPPYGGLRPPGGVVWNGPRFPSSLIGTRPSIESSHPPTFLRDYVFLKPQGVLKTMITLNIAYLGTQLVFRSLFWSYFTRFAKLSYISLNKLWRQNMNYS